MNESKPAVLRTVAPSLSRFDWTLVRSFLAVLEQGSLSAAARRLGSNQPTIGRHVAELESQLDCVLFERTGRGLSATPMARVIADHARAMEEGADALARAVQGRRRETGGTVRITASQTVACYLLPPLLARLRDEEPGIALELVSSNQVSNLLRREADIAVRMVRPVQGALVARRLCDIGIGAYAHRRYLARAGVPQRPEQLLEHTLLGFDTDDGIERAMRAAGMAVGRDSFAVRTDDHVLYWRMLVAGAGIGFVTHHLARAEPQVRRVLPRLPIPPLTCWLAVHREVRSSRPIRRVWDFLAEAIPAAVGAD
jgi:DNA-binding transcriptional LysR family regulator